MEPFTKATGKMIKQVVLAHTTAQMELYTKVHGLMINSTVKAKKIGQTAHNMRVSINKERNKVMGNSYGLMAPVIMETLAIIIFMDKAFTLGKTVGSTKANGKTTKNTAKESTPWQMVNTTKENSLMTRNKD